MMEIPLQLNNIPFCMYNTFSLSIRQLMDMLVPFCDIVKQISN